MTGEGEFISAARIDKLLKNEVKEMENLLDLVVLQSCQSEIVGKVFQKHIARHVICINQNRKVLDEAAIKFSKNLYEAVIKGMPICKAF